MVRYVFCRKISVDLDQELVLNALDFKLSYSKVATEFDRLGPEAATNDAAIKNRLSLKRTTSV